MTAKQKQAVKNILLVLAVLVFFPFWVVYEAAKKSK